MTNWVWLNIPLCVLAIVATVGVPYWLVLRHPDPEPVYARPRLPNEPRPVEDPAERRVPIAA